MHWNEPPAMQARQGRGNCKCHRMKAPTLNIGTIGMIAPPPHHTYLPRTPGTFRKLGVS